MPLDAAAVFSPLDRITDADGEPVAGGTIEFYVAGTSTPKTVYADRDLSVSLGTSVSTDAGGYPVTGGGARTLIYVGTADYKIVVRDASGAILVTHDNVPGAPDIPDTTTSALPTSPVVSRTSTYAIVVGDRGKVINCSSTSFALTLPSASVAGDNWRVCIRHVGAAGQVYTVRTTASQTITFGGQSKTSFALTGYGESVWISCDGSGYHVDAHASPLMKDGLPYFAVEDRLSSPPVSPTGGARYIINGTPTGVWSTLGFVDKQVAEADGNGSWFSYTPRDGWLAYVADEDLLTQYRSSSAAWVDLTNVTAPTSSNLKLMIVEHRETNGTDAGSGTNSSWTDRTLNTEVVNTITGASLASNQITLPVGKYLVSYSQVFESTVLVAGAGSIMEATQRIQAGTAVFSATPVRGLNGRFGGIWTGAGVGVNASDTYSPLDMCYLDVTTGGTLTLQYYKTGGTLGRANSESSGASEIYARVQILDLSSLQGPRGEQGVQGVDGIDAGVPMQWSTSTSGDPGAGKIAGNNSTVSAITELAVSETDAYGNSIAAIIATWDDSTSSIRGSVKITKEGSGGAANFHYFDLTGAGTDQGSYWTFPVSYRATAGTIANGNDVSVLMVPKGDKGETGATGATGATGPSYAATSSTALTIGTGSKSLTTQTGLAYNTASRVRISGTPGTMDGAVTAYDSGTGAMTVLVDQTSGSGSASSWVLSLIGAPGTGTATPAGASGAIQYNSAGAMAGAAGLLWDAATTCLRWVADQLVSLNRLWRFEPLSSDTGDPKFTFGIQRGTWTNGPPAEPNYRDYVAHMGWNWVGGTREDTSQAGYGLSFEHKYYQGGMFGGEWHLQGETSSGTQRRWIGTFLPRDSATGASMSFSFDNISFYDESNNQRFKFTNSSGGKLELLGAAIWQTQNNVATFRQLNAAGTSYLNLGYYNNKDDYVLPSGTWIVGARNPSGTYPGTALAVQATSANSGDSLLNMTGPSVTGEYYAIQTNASSSDRLVLAHYNNNGSSSTAHAEIHIRVLSASSGDPRISFDVNGAGAFALGIDNSDSDKFKLSRAWRALGTNDVFSADSNKFEFHLPVKVPSYTVAGLPSASTVGAGARAFVTDANATTFASIVAGGGANSVPVYSDGTNWRIG